MSGIRAARIIALGSLLLLGNACKKDSSDPARESYTIEGTAKDLQSGAGLAGVSITVAASDASGNLISGNGGSTATDAAGHFSVAPFHYESVAGYALTFVKDGYYDARSSVPANYFSGAGHPATYTLLQVMQAK